MIRVATVKFTMTKKSVHRVTKDRNLEDVTIDRDRKKEHCPECAPPPRPSRIDQSHEQRRASADSRDHDNIVVDRYTMYQ